MHFLLDTDIGSDVDDALAVALIAGSPEITLDGIATVYGDTRLRAQLARRYLRIAGADTNITVAAGKETPWSGREVWWTGHEGALFPDLATEPVDDDGVGYLVRAAAEQPGKLDVLAIGPLTNIAAALDADPNFAANVRRLVIMGADFRAEDRIPEHNIKCDVDAAKRVFSSSLDIIVGGLDLTMKVWLTSGDVAKIAAGGPLGEVLAEEIRIWWKFNNEDGNTPHDPILALYLARPELFTASARQHVEIDDEGFSIPTADETGNVSILDVRDPEAIRQQIVDRIVAGSAAATARAGSTEAR
jgi:purine nucleosidase